MSKAIKDCSTCYYKYEDNGTKSQQYWRCSLTGLYCDTVKRHSRLLCDAKNKGYVPMDINDQDRPDPVEQQDSSDKDVLGISIILGTSIGIVIGIAIVLSINS